MGLPDGEPERGRPEQVPEWASAERRPVFEELRTGVVESRIQEALA